MVNFLFRLAKVVIGAVFAVLVFIPCVLFVITCATVVAVVTYVIRGKMTCPSWLLEDNVIMDWAIDTMDGIIAYGEKK